MNGLRLKLFTFVRASRTILTGIGPEPSRADQFALAHGSLVGEACSKVVVLRACTLWGCAEGML